jgi:hypothetical protein
LATSASRASTAARRSTDREHPLRVLAGRQVEVGEPDALAVATAAQPALRPRVLDQDAAHRLGRRREELCPVGPAVGAVLADAQPRFVHERRRRQRVVRALARHARGGEPAQFVVERAEQRAGVTLRVGHSTSPQAS